MKDGITIEIPQYLDTFVFTTNNAKYCPSHSDMMNIYDNKESTLTYLGTYFPRSYAEAYYIFSNLIETQASIFSQKQEISILDFCCGTGGEIIGMLTAFNETLPNLNKVSITALDGNKYALKLYEKALKEYQNHFKSFVIKHKESPIIIDDIYDLGITSSILEKKFDIILTFKALCEFVSGQQLEEKNPYSHFATVFLPKLNEDGILIMEDLTSKNDVSQEWLPRMMDFGLKNVSCKIIDKNEGYNQQIHISHSQKTNDVSKVAWRILKK